MEVPLSSCARKFAQTHFENHRTDLARLHFHPKAFESARLAVRSGVDWFEAGTPLIVSEGMNGIVLCARSFPTFLSWPP
jgi:hypothetical protein